MSNPTDHTNTTPSKSTLLAKSKEKLSEFFRDRRIKSLLVNVLVPGTLAAALFPVFGPAVAGAAAFVAVKNGLNLLGIKFSDDTIKKLMKPLEGQQLDEDDMQDVLQETFEKLLPEDTQVNEEAAKALVVVAPTLKEAALTNPKLDTTWLGANLESNLKEQGEVMARIASDIRTLIEKEGEALEADRQRLLRDWPRIAVEVVATNKSKVSGVESKAKAAGGAIGHRVAADNESTIETIKMDSEIH